MLTRSGEVDVVRDQQAVPPGQLDEELLVTGAAGVVTEKSGDSTLDLHPDVGAALPIGLLDELDALRAGRYRGRAKLHQYANRTDGE